MVDLGNGINIPARPEFENKALKSHGATADMPAVARAPLLVLLALATASAAGRHTLQPGAARVRGAAGAAAPSASSGCATLVGEQEPALLLDSGASSFTFGTSLFAMTFDRTSLALLNVTSCSADGQTEQGFLWPDGSTSPAATPFSLWQLSYSNCTLMMPTAGGQLGGLNASAGRNFTTAAGPDGSRALTLRWQGLQSGLTGGGGGGTLDVSVAVTMRSGSAQAALRGTVTVSRRDEFCIKNEKLCFKTEEFCIENDEFCRSRPVLRYAFRAWCCPTSNGIYNKTTDCSWIFY